MANLQGFDATKVEPGQPMSALPPGDYLVVIQQSEYKDTKDGTGKYLELVLQVVDGVHKGRKLWDRLNLRNRSQQAQEIAQATLSAICHAVGVLQPKDSSELHDKPMVVTVTTKEYKGNPSNDVRGYRSTSTTKNGVPMTQPATPQSAFTETIDTATEDTAAQQKLQELKEQAPWS